MSRNDSPTDNDPQETTSRTVVGLFSHRAAAEAAILDLTASGFAEDRIGVAMQEREAALRSARTGVTPPRPLNPAR